MRCHLSYGRAMMQSNSTQIRGTHRGRPIGSVGQSDTPPSTSILGYSSPPKKLIYAELGSQMLVNLRIRHWSTVGNRFTTILDREMWWRKGEWTEWNEGVKRLCRSSPVPLVALIIKLVVNQNRSSNNLSNPHNYRFSTGIRQTTTKKRTLKMP